MKKPRKVAALAVFGACVARAVWHQALGYAGYAAMLALHSFVGF